jgi:hypothetical protein
MPAMVCRCTAAGRVPVGDGVYRAAGFPSGGERRGIYNSTIDVRDLIVYSILYLEQ